MTPVDEDEVLGPGSFGASTLRVEMGVGTAEQIVELEVWWPTSGTRQIFRNVAVDQFLEITELAEEYRVLERKRVRF